MVKITKASTNKTKKQGLQISFNFNPLSPKLMNSAYLKVLKLCDEFVMISSKGLIQNELKIK